MGVDVSGIFQALDGGRWRLLETFYDGNRGILRAWLGYGAVEYAFTPALPERGLPPGFDDLSDGVTEPSGLRLDASDLLGDRGLSWLTVAEILAAPPVLGSYWARVSPDFFARFQRWTTPTERWHALRWHLGWPGLPPVLTVARLDTPPTPRPRHVLGARGADEDDAIPAGHTVWLECRCDFTDEIRHFLDTARRVRDTHPDARFVYGFA